MIHPAQLIEEEATLVQQKRIKKESISVVFAKIAQFLSWPLFFIVFNLYFKIHIRGQENFSLAKRPFIVAANHIRFYDCFLFRLALGFWTPHLPLRFMAVKKFDWTFLELASKLGIIALVYKLFAVFTVEQGQGIDKGLATAREIIQAGENIVMYPQGSIVTSDDLGPFKKGTVVLARDANAEIVMVAFRIKKSSGLRNHLYIIVEKPFMISPNLSAEEETRKLQAHLTYMYNA